ncbi:MAG: sigma-70 family RNA polymerase sigma factor [Pirellulales bacterium]
MVATLERSVTAHERHLSSRQAPPEAAVGGLSEGEISSLLNMEIDFIATEEFVGVTCGDAILTEPLIESATAEKTSTADKASSPEQPTNVRRKAYGGGKLPASLARVCENRLLTADEEVALFRRMNYLKYRAAGQRDALDPRHLDLDALQQVKGDLRRARTIRDRIIQANMRLVLSIAGKFVDGAVSFDDLVSEGTLSLMHAVEKFDYSRGFRFSTYATKAIHRNIYRLMARTSKNRLLPAGDATELIEQLCDERESIDRSDKWLTGIRGELADLLDQLDRRERYIIRARFGMGREEQEQTLKSIAGKLGICKERVRQLEHRALDKLRVLAEERKLDELNDMFM